MIHPIYCPLRTSMKTPLFLRFFKISILFVDDLALEAEILEGVERGEKG